MDKGSTLDARVSPTHLRAVAYGARVMLMWLNHLPRVWVGPSESGVIVMSRDRGHSSCTLVHDDWCKHMLGCSSKNMSESRVMDTIDHAGSGEWESGSVNLKSTYFQGLMQGDPLSPHSYSIWYDMFKMQFWLELKKWIHWRVNTTSGSWKVDTSAICKWLLFL